MNLNIIPTEYSGLDCVTGLMISLAEWLNRDYAFVFAEAWNFEFSQEIEEYPYTIGDRLLVNNVVSQELLKSFCGIGISSVCDSNISLEKFMPILKKELAEQRPIMIIHDLFWCPWCKSYFQKIHAPIHYTYVIGFNETGLVCMDYAIRNSAATLPYEYFNLSVNTFVTFDITPTQPDCDLTIQDIIKKVIVSTNSFDTFNTIRKFGMYVKESFDPVKELERFGVDNFNANPLNWQIERISASRRLFASTLRAISKKFNIASLHELANNLEFVVPKWLTVMSMLVKTCIAGNKGSLEKISKKIIELADFEESIFNYLVKINENPHTEFDIQSVLEPGQNVMHVDLSEHCNSRAFDNHEGCTHKPWFIEDKFLLKDNQICSGEINTNTISFKLVNVLEDVKDNIKCKGQAIRLPNKCYKKIGIMGCSAYGNHSADIVVRYEDGHLESIKLDLSNCRPQEAEFEQELLWVGQCVVDRNSNLNRFICQVYGQINALVHTQNVIDILLPDCADMHIFAISLTY